MKIYTIIPFFQLNTQLIVVYVYNFACIYYINFNICARSKPDLLLNLSCITVVTVIVVIITDYV